MSLRDFNNTPASDDPIALHNEPMGNGSGLATFHTTHPEDREPNNTPKIVGAVALALMMGVAAVGLYASWGSSPEPQKIVADNSLPKTAPVAPPPAMAAPANSLTAAPDAAAPDAAAPMPAAAAEAPKPAPVRTASARSARSSASIEATAQARMAAATPTQVPQPAQVTPVPEQAQATPLPAAPSPSPSDVASNTPAVLAAPQEPQSSTPQADNAAPAQDQQSGATPAPAPAQ